MKDGKVSIAEIGPRLKLIRQELGITQKQLAQDLDMNQAILSKFENGGMVYASVLLDVLCYFRDRININYLLQPGDGYSLNDERHRFSNDSIPLAKSLSAINTSDFDLTRSPFKVLNTGIPSLTGLTG